MPAATDKARPLTVSSNGKQASPDHVGPWDRVPSPLPDYRQWVVWRAVDQGNRVGKIPINPATGRLFKNWQNPNRYLSFAEAVQYHAEGIGDGIGFVCTGTDGLVWLDIDKAINEDGQLAEAVYSMLLQLDAPVELSLSGRGYHVPVYAPSVAKAIQAHGSGKLVLDGKQHGFGGLELFVKDCFIALTGDFRNPQLTKVPNRDQVVFYLLRAMWPDKWPPAIEQENLAPICTSETVIKKSCPVAPLSDEDYSMLQRMLNQRDQGKFRRIYGEPYGQPFPETDCRGYSTRSETDLALACKVMFWCGGKNGGGIDQAICIMRASPLRRDKWQERRGDSTYLRETLERAREEQEKRGGFWNGKTHKRKYNRKQPYVEPVPPVPADRLEKRTLSEKQLVQLGLSPAERRTYYALRDQNRGAAWCLIGQATLARNLGVDERTVRNHLRKLESIGLIKIDQRQRPNGKRGKGRMYWFLISPEKLSGQND